MNGNPYEVLGVNSNATDDQIRQAYKELAKKYNSDIYENGPLADVARSRMKELDEAYDAVIAGAQSGTYSNPGYSEPGYNRTDYSAGSDYSDIRATIDSGRLDDAEMLLNGIPAPSRSAQWYYLKGIVQQRRGWLEEAEKAFATASSMEPDNREYRKAYERFTKNRDGGYRTVENEKKGNCSTCDVCSSLLCADCCCECMGGDLIPCC